MPYFSMTYTVPVAVAAAVRSATRKTEKPFMVREVYQRLVVISYPSFVTKTVCSNCAESVPSAVTTVHPSSSDSHVGPAEVDHRLDRERHAGLKPQARAARADVRDVRRLRASCGRCRGRRARVTTLQPSRRASSWMAAPMSPSRAPSRTSAIPISTAARDLDHVRCFRADGLPTKNVAEVSP